ncbi:hypothetical protein TWF694_000196 [Orbilia ellipsospora]|uniref:Actin-like ATPase domain-containing protein n=1 Tax=Orbilia ellipsospora TaxID=2528407 RepID=A0AAV9XQG7_9PEZI
MERERLIVAVDFGTTYSGVAFCHSSKNGLKDSEVVTTWAGNGIAPKTPTEIRYPEIAGKDPLWGAEASVASERRFTSNSNTIYNRFKLLLDPTVEKAVYTDPITSLLDRYGRMNLGSSIKLPVGKTAIDVSTDYLRLLYEDLMHRVFRKRLPDTLDITSIEFVFTIPAIWGHKAQEATRYAAKTAGFCSRSMDTLTLVSEPEAAAMYVLHAMGEQNFSRISDSRFSPFSLPKGENFVICDAGGGTVDLISYEVEKTSPKLQLKEAAVGTGAKCGSSYVDEAFLKHLRRKIGPSFDDENVWTQKHIGKGSSLMKSFDSIKKSLGQTSNDIWFLELPVHVEDDENAGIMDNELELTLQDLKDLFDPVVEETIKLVESQVNIVRATCGDNKLSTVFLVGGFGESQYLYQRLVEWAQQQNPPLVVVNPSESWSAIMRGAVIHALQSRSTVTSRRLRQHYGFACSLPFDNSEHDITDATECPFGGWYLRDSVEWAAKRGEECESTREIKFPVYRVLDSAEDLEEPFLTRLLGFKGTIAPTFSHNRGK